MGDTRGPCPGSPPAHGRSALTVLLCLSSTVGHGHGHGPSVTELGCWGVLNRRNYGLMALEPETPRSVCGQGWFLLASLLGVRTHLHPVSSQGCPSGRACVLVPFHEDNGPLGSGPPGPPLLLHCLGKAPSPDTVTIS